MNAIMRHLLRSSFCAYFFPVDSPHASHVLNDVFVAFLWGGCVEYLVVDFFGEVFQEGLKRNESALSFLEVG